MVRNQRKNIIHAANVRCKLSCGAPWELMPFSYLRIMVRTQPAQDGQSLLPKADTKSFRCMVIVGIGKWTQNRKLISSSTIPIAIQAHNPKRGIDCAS